MKRISIVLFMLVALVAAACTSDQGGSAAASASDGAEEPGTAESQAAGESQAAEESADDGGTGAVPSFELPASAPELAALLPDEILGQEAVKISMSGEEMMESEDAEVDPEFIAFLQRVGAQPEDVSFAFSFGFDAEGNSAGIAAFRVEGANSDQLESEFQATLESDGTPIEWDEASVAGKDVLTAEDPETSGNQVYLYTVGDIVFFVTASEEATAVELLEPLP